MPRSEARVATERPHRYAKQLAAHLGRKVESSWDEETGRGALTFKAGSATLAAEPGALLLAVEGEAEDLDRLEDVVGRHLVRFGTKDELVAEWHRDNGTPGSVQRNQAEDAEGGVTAG
ncbi:DUF2218 domain-containing protein [Streptacidiphilus sp. P02-A3a]|uniref:DUF2218 domain-containing protein n=1 Tax=Streptacidiphilus sp. P02-A3a TaxID=2704468 RepID=UPI0015FC51C9|nr:DUF2218 domain-containing protein [Streptacidiphilus sp. P02-A3a]QMU68009.1 DUF2218 domain-containing protein [Streptacidiphilus sp. P02-A3a]